MIQQLELHNFQSHPHSLLEFEKGVNVIVGPSDSGKTALFRAFRWLMYNRPLGEAFRSYWGGDTRVEVVLSDGHKISRWKTDKDHGYTLDGEEFRALKSDVPEEIEKALNMSSINFQQQFDRPFLLDESPGGVAAHFNRISHLESIDRGIRNLIRGEKEIRKTIQANETRIQEITEELKEFEGLDELDALVCRAIVLDDTQALLYEEKLRIRTVLGNISTCDRELVEVASVLILEPLYNKAMKLIKQREERKARKAELAQDIIQLNQWNREAKALHKVLKLELLIEKTDTNIQAKQEAQNFREQLEHQIQAIREEEIKLQKAQEQITQYEREYQEAFPDICPLCGNVINKKAV